MKKMKFLMGVLVCFLVTLSFDISHVSAANYTTNPTEYFSELGVVGEDGVKISILEQMVNGSTSCITISPGFCLGEKVHIVGTLTNGTTVTYNSQDYTSTFNVEVTLDNGDEVITFTATNGTDTYDFSITISGSQVCQGEKTYCIEDPSKDDEVQACIDGGKTEAECIAEYCPTEEKTYCTEDPSKDDEVQACIDGGKTEAECIAEYCPTEEKTYCTEDPSKDDEVQKCIDEGGEEADCVQKICVTENPKTGIASPMIAVVGLITLVVANVLIFRKREN